MELESLTEQYIEQNASLDLRINRKLQVNQIIV